MKLSSKLSETTLIRLRGVWAKVYMAKCMKASKSKQSRK